MKSLKKLTDQLKSYGVKILKATNAKDGDPAVIEFIKQPFHGVIDLYDEENVALVLRSGDGLIFCDEATPSQILSIIEEKLKTT